MGEETKIQWADKTFSPWRGCTKVAPECANCYADAGSKRNPQTLGVWGPNGRRVVAADSAWREVEKWDREAAAAGVRYRVFPSLCDPFEDWQGDMHDHRGRRLWIDRERGGEFIHESAGFSFAHCRPVTMADVRRRYFDLIDRTPNLDHLLLTKRPENILAQWPQTPGIPRTCVRDSEIKWDRPTQLMFRPNVWLLASAGTEATLNKFAHELHRCRDLAPVIGYSAEPLLERVCLRLGDYPVDIVIVGGESGPNARPCDIAWIQSIVDQCRAAGVACYVKQLGANVEANDAIDAADYFPGSVELSPASRRDFSYARVHLKHPKGGDIEEFPLSLRVREFPTVATAPV